MKNRLKRLTLILGAATLMLCQSGEGASLVRAQEKDETLLTENTAEKKTEGTEEKKEEADTEGKKEEADPEGKEEKETEGKKEETDPEEKKEEEKREEDTEEKKEETEEKKKDSEGLKPTEEKKEEEETKATEEIDGTEEDTTLSDTSAESEDKQLEKATDLRWTSNGQGSFTNPNEHSFFRIEVVKEDSDFSQIWNEYDEPYGKNDVVTLDLYHLVAAGGTGTYKFRVMSVANGYQESDWTDFSDGFTYTEPSVELPVPIVSVSEGVVSCSLPEGSNYTLATDYGFNYVVVTSDGDRIVQWGNNHESIDALDTFAELLTDGRQYFIRVQTLSRDITKYKDSDWAADIELIDKRDHSNKKDKKKDREKDNKDSKVTEIYEENAAEESASKVEAWKPSTPDEIKRYEVFGKDRPVYTADAGNAYSVTVYNAMQGQQCFEVFESVLEGWKIGRTYNIMPSGRQVYKMDGKVRITLQVPKALQADGRAYKMICVTQNGQPIVLNDLDSAAETITFETDSYYAFALAYKD